MSQILYKWWIKACVNLGIENIDLYGGTRHSSTTALREHFSPEQIKRDGTRHSSKAFDRYLQAQNLDSLKIYEKAVNTDKPETVQNNVILLKR
ncbi:MAG: hypothetical protein HQK77_01750 [Desulfobacterales bacterium]|nr:hypothetical protein [Desulfobacterales bacterium]